jgi:hypothetical protein
MYEGYARFDSAFFLVEVAQPNGGSESIVVCGDEVGAADGQEGAFGQGLFYFFQGDWC